MIWEEVYKEFCFYFLTQLQCTMNELEKGISREDVVQNPEITYKNAYDNLIKEVQALFGLQLVLDHAFRDASSPDDMLPFIMLFRNFTQELNNE